MVAASACVRVKGLMLRIDRLGGNDWLCWLSSKAGWRLVLHSNSRYVEHAMYVLETCRRYISRLIKSSITVYLVVSRKSLGLTI